MSPLDAIDAVLASRLGSTESLVLLAWARHLGQNNHDRAWPSVGRLVARTRLSEASVKRALRLLRSIGVLVLVGDHPSGTRVYRIDLAALASYEPGARVTPDGAADDEEGGHGDTPPGVMVTPHGGHGDTPPGVMVTLPPGHGDTRRGQGRGQGEEATEEPPGGPPQAPIPGGEVWLAAWTEVCPGVEYALGGRADARALREIRLVAGGDDVMLEACRAYLQAESGRRKVWPPDEGVSPRKMARQVGGWCTAARATLQARPAPPAADSTEAYEPAWSLEAHASGWTLSVDGLAWACTDELAAMAAALAEAHAGTALLSAARHAELLEQLHSHPSSDRLTA